MMQVAPSPAEPNLAEKAAPEPQKPRLSISVSPAAAEYAKKRLIQRGTPDAIVRLGVKGGSCSGYSYVIQFDDEPPRERDTVYEEGGVKFVIDKKSLVYLAGSLLDFEKTVMFQGFKFRNPQEASSCGCGHSFSVKK
jgi:iron-sulfur cluster assembly protein